MKRCLCHCKDTNFSANHNGVALSRWVRGGVYATAKILIFQQITTLRSPCRRFQRCLCHCKDTNFSANHNFVVQNNDRQSGVYATAKILIFQQITTSPLSLRLRIGCLCHCKDTNFSANHNCLHDGGHDSAVFMPLQRY